jgi:hypothetical protein
MCDAFKVQMYDLTASRRQPCAEMGFKNKNLQDHDLAGFYNI